MATQDTPANTMPDCDKALVARIRHMHRHQNAIVRWVQGIDWVVLKSQITHLDFPNLDPETVRGVTVDYDYAKQAIGQTLRELMYIVSHQVEADDPDSLIPW